ncbi:hypothetical protein H5410_051788 [Solanum commersonii]|uniref:DUF1985 domain-containing protein n=1 Tax=Solanum commersonii TaxID=4109 RepID=A0A9J5WZ28_SOLCO|nr:hypothetical protein H5410_051788 [Solanum commersonii]
MDNPVFARKEDEAMETSDPKWAENRSKSLHDPLTMAKQSSKKSKAKKEAHAKTPKKRGRKVAPTISRSALPTIPKHSLKFGSAYNRNFIRDLALSIGYEGIQSFKDTIFGPYLNIPKRNYQGQITKCLFLLEVEQDNPAGERHICHAKGNILNFSIKEFVIITNLKCIRNSKDFTYPDSKRSRLVQRYFPGPDYNVNKQRLVDRFIIGGWDSIDDALQMAIMYSIHTFVLSQLGTASIPIEDFLMVEDGSYQQFSWGQLAFTRLMNSLRQEFKSEKQMYRLNGMPYAVNVWVYECASMLDNDIAVKEQNIIPRICNWKVVVEKPKFEMFMESIFTDNNCANIQPTVEEITSLDLPHISHVSPTEPTPSNVNPEVGQPQEVAGFEDFSSKPSNQLLRRSIRVSSTRSTPLPKRKKVVHPHKTNVSKATRLYEQPNQPFQTPDLQTSEAGNVSSVPDNSDIRKVIFDNSQLEGLKQYLKGYELIKQNHSELMKVVGAKDNKSEKRKIKLIHNPLLTGPFNNLFHLYTWIFQFMIKILMDLLMMLNNKLLKSMLQSDDTSFKEQVMEDATEVIHTTHHSHALIEEVVLNKEADDAIDAAPQSDTKVLSGDEHVKESAHNPDTKTPAPRNRIPSRIVRSLYLTSFGSRDKGKAKIDDDVRQLHPFEGYSILYQMSSSLMDEFSQWIEKGLLKSQENKKPFEDKYRAKSALFGVDHIDFVHIDVIFYYLCKKSKQRGMNQYRYTTVNYLFTSHINNAHTRYYNSPANDIISAQEHIAHGAAVSIHERSIINVINGFLIPAALPWHLVDEVYIPVNCDEEFHWVLVVVEVHSGVIKKLSQILPNYLHDSGFFEKIERTDWAALDAYKDKKIGELLSPQHSFDVEFAQDMMQQESNSLPLWKYGLDKAKAGYVRDNDDPPRLKSVLNPATENELVNVA